MRTKIILFAFLCASFPAIIHAATYRVGHGTGYDFSTISEALYNAVYGDVILVADGNYSRTTRESFPIKLKNGVTLQRENTSIQPKIIGDYNSSVIIAKNFRNYLTVLDGFWISAGVGYLVNGYRYGGGIFCQDANLTIQNCIIGYNSAYSGGGIAYLNSCPEIRNCTFRNNSATIGGGLYSYSYARISRCYFTHNSVTQYGAGLYIDSSNPIIKQCTISYNYGSGLSAINRAVPNLVNSILWWNYDDLYYDWQISLTNCCVGDGDWINVNGCFSTPPLFNGMENVDFRLSANSPCIDRGIDIGESYFGAAPDVGAHETGISGPLPLPTPSNVTVGNSGDFQTISEAVRKCAPGSHLQLTQVDYNLTSGEIFPMINYGISIAPSFPDQSVTIRSNGNNSVMISAYINYNISFTLSKLHLTSGYGYQGGALRLLGARPAIINCDFSSSTATYGGSVYCNSVRTKFSDCRFFNNYADYGGSLYIFDSNLTFQRCAFFGNSAIRMAGISSDYSIAKLYNCTVTNNYGAGFYTYQSRIDLVNSILWWNMDDLFIDGQPGENIVTATNCNIGDADYLGFSNNISSPPAFIDMAGNDFQLAANSPCIDRGIQIPGQSYQGLSPDIGAYESRFSGQQPLPTPGVFTVKSDGDFDSLTEALQNSAPGSTIRITEGTYGWQQGESLPFILYGVSLEPDTPDANVTLRGVNSLPVIVSCYINPSKSSNISNIVIRNGGGNYGGGLLVNATISLDRCVIYNNNTDYQGGGIYGYKADILINDCYIGSNGSYYGGGIAISNSQINSIKSDYYYNLGNYYGGALYITNGSQAILDTSHLISNQSYIDGGGLQCEWSDLRMLNSIIFYNGASGYGGGGVFAYDGNISIINCTITGNGAVIGGGFYVYDVDPTLKNCILWGNYPDELSVPVGSPVLTYCDINGGYSGSGNIDAKPMFADELYGDFRLRQGSPCIDAGSNLNAPNVDFQDEARPNPDTGIVDIGADEYHYYPTTTPIPTDTPQILMAGYWNTNLQADEEGNLNILALTINSTQVEIWVDDNPTGVYLPTYSGAADLFWLQNITLSPLPSQQFLFGLGAKNDYSSSGLWPYLNVK